jgi:ribosomal protein S18 acetylase RimI-like enzyme
MRLTDHDIDSQRVDVRPAKPDELDAIRDLDRAVFGSMSYPYFVLRQLFDLYRPCWMVLDHPAGLIGYSLGAPAVDGTSAWLLGLGVREEFRRRGYGRQLAMASLRFLEATDVSEVYLSVDGENVAAVNMYKSLGFTISAIKNDYLGPGEHRAIMLANL